MGSKALQRGSQSEKALPSTQLPALPDGGYGKEKEMEA